MKASTKTTPLRASGLRAAVLQLWQKAAVRQACLCGGIFLAAFFLSSLAVVGNALPLAACLTAAVAFWPQSVFAAAGACLGYWLAWGVQGALEPVAITILVFAGCGIFHDTYLPASDWFTALMCAGLTASVGFVFLLDAGVKAATLVWFAAKVLMAAGFPLLCRQALQAERKGGLLAALFLVFAGVASSFVPYGFCVAALVAFAVAVSSAQVGLLPTLLCMGALDLSARAAFPVTAAVCCGALLCRLLPRPTAPVRCAVLVTVAISWQLLLGALSVPFCICAAAGGIAGIFLPIRWPEQYRDVQLPQTASEQRLCKLSKVFAMMNRELADIAPVACRTEISDIYDSTAEQVCRCCERYRSCWQTQAESTYQSLCDAAVPIMRRGSAVREDFPPAFSEQCRHMEGFITAVNQELDANLCKRQLRSRLQESRQILSDQYLFLSRFLGTLTQQEDTDDAPARYTPDFAVSSRCRTGNSICGDRGASFRDRQDNYYVLLCDGMGTGEQAAQESGKAVRILTGLLESGVAPDSAMELLNGFYVLHEGSAFSTVDLLRVSLRTGSGTLYKWGAPPSYLRSADTVKEIGTASPPPGLGVGSDHTAQQLKLSLKNGETLVIVSDGASGEETEQRIAGFRGSTSRELASYLAACADDSGDDRTVAVLQLTSASSCSNHNIQS